MKKNTARLILIASASVLLVSYSNCSQFKVEGEFAQSLASSSASIPSVGGGTPGTVESDYQIANATGAIPAYQDRLFRFKIDHTDAAATYVVTNKPAWLSLDAATGELFGVPTTLTDAIDMSIAVTEAGVTKNLGPFKIDVFGNPLKEQQWHLKNTGQRAYAALAGTADQDIHQTETIKAGILGKGIKVAVSDSGVSESHRGLSANILGAMSRNYLNDYAITKTWSGNSSPATNTAANAHGTAVAGLIAQRGWNDIGGRGVAPLANISGFLFIQAQTQLSQRGYLTAGLYDQFAGEFDIFNYSWGDTQCFLSEYDAAFFDKLKYGVTNYRAGKGAIYMMASGNDFYALLRDCYPSAAANAYFFGNSNFSEVASSPYTIIVSALNANGVSSSYASPGSNLWISAPGGEYGLSTAPNGSTTQEYLMPALISTDFTGCTVGLKTSTAQYSPFNQGTAPNTDCEHVANMNGTSAATPVASGAVALILSANPNLTWRDVKHILATTSDKIDPNGGNTAHPVAGSNLTGHVYQQGWVTNAAGFPFHNWYGFGRVNVDKAVIAAKAYVAGSLGAFQETGFKYDSGTLNATAPAGSAAGISRTLAVVENLKAEAVQVRFSGRNCLGNVGLELTSPSGTKSILMNINSGILDSTTTNHILLSNAFYGENTAGTWTLKMISGASTCSPVLTSWQLNILGH